MGSFSSVKKTEISVRHDKPQISETWLAMQSFTYQNPQLPISLDSTHSFWRRNLLASLNCLWASQGTSSRRRSSSLVLSRFCSKILCQSLNRRVYARLMVGLVRKTNSNHSTKCCVSYEGSSNAAETKGQQSITGSYFQDGIILFTFICVKSSPQCLVHMLEI